ALPPLRGLPPGGHRRLCQRAGASHAGGGNPTRPAGPTASGPAGGPAGCVGLGSPSPVSAGPGPGVRLPLRRAGGEIHRGWRPPAGRGHQMNARHPGIFPGAPVFSGHSAHGQRHVA
ncbi:hypothetical protein LEFCBN_LEFCBN_01450, partial [Dysosmobacter welbionis]